MTSGWVPRTNSALGKPVLTSSDEEDHGNDIAGVFSDDDADFDREFRTDSDEDTGNESDHDDGTYTWTGPQN